MVISESQTYPREDVCAICGVHIGWILDEVGEMVALGRCDEHREKDEKEEDSE